MSESIFALSYTNQEGHNVVLKSCPSLRALGVSPYFYLDGFQGDLRVLNPEGVECVDLMNVQVWAYQEGNYSVCGYLDCGGVEIPVEEYHETPVHYRYHLMTLGEAIPEIYSPVLELYRCYRHLEEAQGDAFRLAIQGRATLILDRVSGEVTGV